MFHIELHVPLHDRSEVMLPINMQSDNSEVNVLCSRKLYVRSEITSKQDNFEARRLRSSRRLTILDSYMKWDEVTFS